jgi:hypothetical protein
VSTALSKSSPAPFVNWEKSARFVAGRMLSGEPGRTGVNDGASSRWSRRATAALPAPRWSASTVGSAAAAEAGSGVDADCASSSCRRPRMQRAY